MACYSCQEYGHFSRECRKNKHPGNGQARQVGTEKVVKRGYGTEPDERRIPGQRCRRCWGEHFTTKCPTDWGTLHCNYPPCTHRVGHVGLACEAIMKRCRMEECMREKIRGHTEAAHRTRRPNGEILGQNEAARKILRRDYQVAQAKLRWVEKERVRRWENENKQ